jgi:UDP-N-acetylmuramoyl-tripeptide--D-alanyl-D-alanine ligase
MPMLDLRRALGWLSAGRLMGDPAATVDGVCTDTRALRPGELFVALRGERHDGNDHLWTAHERGAAAVMFDRWTDRVPLPAIWVPDGRRALGELAAGWRRQFSLPLIAVTGSNGKTTVKEMLAAILAQACGEDGRLATLGNLNNDVGVPLTLLRLGSHHRAAVLELGMNQPGEIAWIAALAAPTVALVNNAQREHQEFLGSVEATALENGQAIAALAADGVAVFPGDDACSGVWRDLAGRRTRIEFGLCPLDASPLYPVSAPPQAQPGCFTMNLRGQLLEVKLAIDGAHNVRNALAAAACALAAGIVPAAIVAGLGAFRPAAGRMARGRAAQGALLIDDSYNANPDSVIAAIDTLAAMPGHQVLVLGDMGEVGEQGPAFHREVGAHARDRGLAHLLAVGEATRASVEAFGPGGEHFADLDALVARAQELAGPTACLLVKGSRFMRMERVVAALAGAPTTLEAH